MVVYSANAVGGDGVSEGGGGVDRGDPGRGDAEATDFDLRRHAGRNKSLEMLSDDDQTVSDGLPPTV